MSAGREARLPHAVGDRLADAIGRLVDQAGVARVERERDDVRDLEPPEGGGETTIVYPFAFAPADEP